MIKEKKNKKKNKQTNENDAFRGVWGSKRT